MASYVIHAPSTLARIEAAVRALGGDVAVCEVGPPATEAQVQAVERQVARALPGGLRRLFLEQSASLRMFWTIENGGHLPHVLGESLGGSIDLSLADLPACLLNWSGWRAAFEDPAAHDWPPELSVDVFERLFPLVGTGNGDQIVIAEPEDPQNEIVYLNHEGGDFDFVVLADSLDEFLATWIALGCPGPEWYELARFLDPKTSKLSLKTRRSKAWLEAMSSAVRTA